MRRSPPPPPGPPPGERGAFIADSPTRDAMLAVPDMCQRCGGTGSRCDVSGGARPAWCSCPKGGLFVVASGWVVEFAYPLDNEEEVLNVEVGDVFWLIGGALRVDAVDGDTVTCVAFHDRGEVSPPLPFRRGELAAYQRIARIVARPS